MPLHMIKISSRTNGDGYCMILCPVLLVWHMLRFNNLVDGREHNQHNLEAPSIMSNIQIGPKLCLLCTREREQL